jgi:hypothetical protein
MLEIIFNFLKFARLNKRQEVSFFILGEEPRERAEGRRARRR